VTSDFPFQNLLLHYKFTWFPTKHTILLCTYHQIPTDTNLSLVGQEHPLNTSPYHIEFHPQYAVFCCRCTCPFSIFFASSVPDLGAPRVQSSPSPPCPAARADTTCNLSPAKVRTALDLLYSVLYRTFSKQPYALQSAMSNQSLFPTLLHLTQMQVLTISSSKLYRFRPNLHLPVSFFQICTLTCAKSCIRGEKT